ncbi:hypothetical protein Btru_062837 [Bulinus truncatus]|nr:hypothetical protein Btru_062837 [Bulinus truncatus]
MEASDKWAYSKLSLQTTPDTRIIRGSKPLNDDRKIFARLKAELEAKARSKKNSIVNGQPPIDEHSKIYLAFVLSGIGYMLPFTCFIAAVDYYQSRFPHSTIIFDMTTTTIVVGMLGVFLNNLLLETLSLTWRVMIGYIVSTLLLLFLTLFDVTMDMFPLDTGYWVTLVAVAVIAVGCAVQQSSFYGYANMLPRRYTQAVMLGESLAGVLVSINRILTKLLLENERVNTIIFFIISLVIIVVCCAAFFFARWTRFVRHHLRTCKADGRSLECGETEFKMQRGSMQPKFRDSIPEACLVVANTDLQPQASADVITEMTDNRMANGQDLNKSDTEKWPEEIDGNLQTCLRGRDSVIDPPGRMADMGSTSSLVQGRLSSWKARLDARLEVIRQIYPYMTSFALTFYVTVSLYPGIISEVVSCRLGTWMPVVLMACFNITDALGKMFAAVINNYSKLRLLLCTLCRLCLIPMVILCIKPRFRPILSGEAWSIFITILLGVSNGYFGCLPLVLAPSQVTPRLRELCGNTMMLSFTLAIVAGTFTSYGLDILVGPHPGLELCHLRNVTLTNITQAEHWNSSHIPT